MDVEIIIFGQLTDIFKTNKFRFQGAASDTNELIGALNNQYPGFEHATYTIAVNKQTITLNSMLHEGAVVALMPPFSGG